MKLTETKKHSRLWWLLPIALFVVAGAVLLYVLLPRSSPSEENLSAVFLTPVEERVESTAQEAYISPVDFAALQKINPHVYAFLEIPGTDIAYPVVQHPSDDSFYLSRNLEGKTDSSGSIYSQHTYNSTTLQDPVTVLYGHNQRDGSKFGTLQTLYTSTAELEKHQEIILYLPERELHYQVFAAVPFDNRHLLYGYDYSDSRTMRLLQKELLSIHHLKAVYSNTPVLPPSAPLLILSTCFTGQDSMRFLLCGYLLES